MCIIHIIGVCVVIALGGADIGDNLIKEKEIIDNLSITKKD
jgi:hypothetical protein